jgi:hypothetical protein
MLSVTTRVGASHHDRTLIGLLPAFEARLPEIEKHLDQATRNHHGERTDDAITRALRDEDGQLIVEFIVVSSRRRVVYFADDRVSGDFVEHNYEKLAPRWYKMLDRREE